MTDSKNGSLAWGMSSRELGGMILSSLVVTDSTIDLVFPSVLLTQFSMSALMLAFVIGLQAIGKCIPSHLVSGG